MTDRTGTTAPGATTTAFTGKTTAFGSTTITPREMMAAPRETATPPARTELRALARICARAHALRPDIVCAIVEQESAWNPWAIRYEPAFFEHYIAPQIARGALADATEARARAFSWGLMQVMGQVVRENGFAGASLAALCEPSAGLDIGCRVFAAKLAAAQGSIAQALLLWNGGANPQYAEAVLARAARYSTT